MLEWRFPVLLEDFHIRKGSGGQGAHIGGDGVVRRLRFLEPMQASILSDHRQVPPYGMADGGAGKTGHNAVEREDGSTETLGGTDTTDLNAGDCIIIETPGGGGYGPASD